MFLWTLTCNSFNAKRFIHVSVRLNNVSQGCIWPFGATVWAPVQEKVAVIGVYVNSKYVTHEWSMQKDSSMYLLRLNNVTMCVAPIGRPPGSGARTWPGSKLQMSLLIFPNYKYSPMSGMRQFLSVYCFSWVNDFVASGPYMSRPPGSLYRTWSVGSNATPWLLLLALTYDWSIRIPQHLLLYFVTYVWSVETWSVGASTPWPILSDYVWNPIRRRLNTLAILYNVWLIIRKPPHPGYILYNRAFQLKLTAAANCQLSQSWRATCQ